MTSSLGMRSMQRLGVQAQAPARIALVRPCRVAPVRPECAAASQGRRFSHALRAAEVDTVSVDMTRSDAAPVEAPEIVGLQELQQDTFWPFLEAAGDNLVIVDFFTDWCGPCKMIYPDLVKLSAELKATQGVIVKFNCNRQNKDLGKQLAIRVAPTFHLYRNKEKVAEMTGAQIGKLRGLVNDQQAKAGRALVAA